MDEDEFDPKPMTVKCCRCRISTNHRILFDKCISGGDEEYDYWYSTTHRVVQCLGCEDISYVTIESNSEDPPVYLLFPLRSENDAKNTLAEPRVEQVFLPEKVSQIYSETIRAHNSGAPLLATIGMRSLVEAICLDQNCTGNLREKINELVEKGLISRTQSDLLHIHRFLGNEAAHEISLPPQFERLSALEIIETMLETIYKLPRIANRIATSRQNRGKE